MNRKLLIILILFLSVILSACDKEKSAASDGKTIDVYYVDSKTYKLVSESYDLISTKTKDQISELLYMLRKTPKKAVNRSALPAKAEFEISFDDNGVLIVDFNESYHDLSGADEILCRAAVVKTLTQIADIHAVQISIEGQMIQEADKVVGPLTAEDFIDNTESNTTYEAKLYFTNKEGDSLIEYSEDIDYTGVESIEELVISQLIEGPSKVGLYPTIPKGTKLLTVSKSDGICTVDFNDNFLNNLSDVNETIAIYSIVNTLVELPDINKVQFTINGIDDKVVLDDVELFEANLNLIKKS